MYYICVRNVNEAYRRGANLLNEVGQVMPSRAGTVVKAPRPVTTEYTRPNERVLFDEKRNANPFFHIAESVWMLAGERDARWLDQFVHDFSSRFAEDDGQMHGAYGHRWIRHFGVDQISVVADMLKSDPYTRRAVIGMWDPTIDLGVNKRDIPCNDVIFFRSREDRTLDGELSGFILDMTVCCRSNDMIWGAYGANAVHFSVLQEFIAGAAGMKLGSYYQISNDFHAYTTSMRPPGRTGDLYSVGVKTYPVFSPYLLEDCEKYVRGDGTYISPWLVNVVNPMLSVHKTWKIHGPARALRTTHQIAADDWRAAAEIFLTNRLEARKS